MKPADCNGAHPAELAEDMPPPPEDGPPTDPVDVPGWGWERPDTTWLEVEPVPRRYLLHDAGSADWTRGPGLLPRGKVAILAGGGGVGKTLALCGLALSVVTRSPWLGRYPTGEGLFGRVALLLGEEDAAELHRRLWFQARAMGLGREHSPALTRILALPGAGNDRLALTRAEEPGKSVKTPAAAGLRAFLEAEAERNGEGWDLVVLDPLSRFAGPDVEIDNSAATRLVQVLEGFTTLPGNPAVVMAHHLAKHARGANSPADGAVGVRGSSAIVDGARWVGNLEPLFRNLGTRRQPEYVLIPGKATFRVSKSNYAAFPHGELILTRCDGGGLRACTADELRDLWAQGAPLKGRKPGGGGGRGNAAADKAAGDTADHEPDPGV